MQEQRALAVSVVRLHFAQVCICMTLYHHDLQIFNAVEAQDAQRSRNPAGPTKASAAHKQVVKVRQPVIAVRLTDSIYGVCSLLSAAHITLTAQRFHTTPVCHLPVTLQTVIDEKCRSATWSDATRRM
jgi:hypothetical protein